MTFVNLTPHSVTVHGGDAPLTVPPSGTVARVATATREVARVGGVPILAQEYGEVTGLPDQQDGVLLVVSALVRLASAAARAEAGMPPREDVVSPGELVRDAAGQPVGCRGLVVSL